MNCNRFIGKKASLMEMFTQFGNNDNRVVSMNVLQ